MGKGPLPGGGVLIDCVDQCAVDVENYRLDHVRSAAITGE
jgi:hypothetical protein